ncbi:MULTISPECIES: hypothetical protein [unclassified Streptomyces]|uniref:hypothetical protein n=1 Tax=unclassified Streptomyces TaxID=2593676 RepID=UPI0011E71121|nr:hypothetical protein [Streptomyces sp. sk2.1]TXS68597.1 hypothetical protein EAO76_27185 [Streptomyces sp. sk2.1]
MKITLGSLAAGAGFGAVTSLVNALSSPYTEIGAPLRGTPGGRTAKVLSLLLDAGWAWAALAVVAGWLAGTLLRGALAGTLSLIAATSAYYVTDAYVADAESAMAYWAVAALLFGPALGAVGAAARRPGRVGLLAALTVPLGAAAQMVVMPPRPHLTLTPSIVLAEAVVWTGAVLGVVLAVRRFRGERRTVSPV